MQRLIEYLMGSVLVSGMLTAYYWIALRNRKLHGYNRIYLLGSMVLSLGLPLMRLGWAPFGDGEGRIWNGAVQRATGSAGVARAGSSWVMLACCLAAAVSLSLLFVMLWRVAQLCRSSRRQKIRRMGGYDLIETDDPRAPFSFLNTLFWRRGADPEEPLNRRILFHELAHIGGRHSWDSLFAQGLCCIFWMNPFFWLMRRELGVVHEFIADAATGMEGDGEGFARMLLQSMNEGRWLAPGQGFFQSPVRRRLRMMSRGRQVRFGALRMLLTAPVVLAVMLVVSCSKERPALDMDKIDQVKLAKERLDQKIRVLVLGQINGKLNLTVSRDSLFPVDEQKRRVELKLRELENPVFITGKQ